ncbi:hypothetical protein O181_124065 [Austropuccinia psidii MF-1]|uniref:Uncharacterized protein n=1 Tax=Austropuccinia psidii MF-1 TaxID=1389203 RepID=A0A9Q3KSE5_9BASI|nr:hypothetical protein [Austropuccinia psidii MF-1]
MSSKLTELTESSPSAPPPSVLRGSGVFSQLSSPSMASSGHFYPSQTYDGYKAVEVLVSQGLLWKQEGLALRNQELTWRAPTGDKKYYGIYFLSRK